MSGRESTLKNFRRRCRDLCTTADSCTDWLRGWDVRRFDKLTAHGSARVLLTEAI